jgi:hypothetical protein
MNMHKHDGGFMSKYQLWIFIFSAILIATIKPGWAVQRTVLAEQFTGTWCQYCPGAQMGLRNLKTQVRDSLTVLAYHLSDPFTVPECNTRSSYYGVSGIPHVNFDGVLTRIGGSNTQPVNYRDLFDARRAVPPSVEIVLTDAFYNPVTGAGSVTARVTNVSTTTLTANLRFAMVGKETTYYWQGQSKLYDIVLGMFPNGASGEQVMLSAGDYLLRSYNYTIPSAWRNRQCAIVCFFQNDGTKEVYNAREIDITASGIEERLTENLSYEFVQFSHPVRNQVRFIISQPASQPVILKIYDPNGRLINEFNPNSQELIWNLTDYYGNRVSKGVYLIKGEFGQRSVIKKLIIAE